MTLNRTTYSQAATLSFQDAVVSPTTVADGTLRQRFDPRAYPQVGVKYAGYLGHGDNPASPAAVAVAQTTPGDGTHNAVQTVTITNSPTLGAFTLTYGGQTTGSLAYNALMSEVQAALEALSNVGAGQVVVTGSNGGPYIVTFGGTLGNVAVTPITGTGSFPVGDLVPAAARAVTG